MQYKDNDVWVGIYCRLSEEDRNKQNEIDDSRSIQNQKSMLISYAEKNNWKVYKIYSDDDYTGADRNRPAFNELIKDAKEKKFKIVLCKSQSRFTREMELVEHYLHDLFPQWGIRFVGLVDNADTENKGNKKARQINGLVNEWYLEDLSENIKEVLTDRRKKGYHIGAFAPYGYKKDPDYPGHLIPDETAAVIVHRIYEMFAGGMGKSAIARFLNREGIPNPTEYKRLQGIRWRRNTDSPRSGMWQYFSVAEILSNEVYIGNMVQGKYASTSYKTQICKPQPKENWIRVENTHAPIIERELWDKVQGVLKERAKPGWNGQVGMFARKARCMYCGYIMRSDRRGERRYLRCSSTMINPDICRGGFIGLGELENTILEELHILIDKYLDMDEATRQLQIRDEHKMKKMHLENELYQLEAKASNYEKTLKALYMDRVQGIISPEEYAGFAASFREEAKSNSDKIAAINEQIAALDAQKENDKSKREIMEQFANITELNYDIVNTLIDYVEIGRRDGHYRNTNVPVVIHWKF